MNSKSNQNSRLVVVQNQPPWNGFLLSPRSSFFSVYIETAFLYYNCCSNCASKGKIPSFVFTIPLVVDAISTFIVIVASDSVIASSQRDRVDHWKSNNKMTASSNSFLTCLTFETRPSGTFHTLFYHRFICSSHLQRCPTLDHLFVRLSK